MTDARKIRADEIRLELLEQKKFEDMRRFSEEQKKQASVAKSTSTPVAPKQPSVVSSEAIKEAQLKAAIMARPSIMHTRAPRPPVYTPTPPPMRSPYARRSAVINPTGAKTGRTKQAVKAKVIKHGKQAIAESGFATPFVAALVSKTKEIHCSIALRAGQAPNIDAPCEVAPKPMAVKTKTSSDQQGLPCVAGWIPIDQATFGRSGSKDVPPEFGGSNPEKNAFHSQTSLRSILTDAKAGKYEIVRNGDFLEFKSLLPDTTKYTDYDREHGKGLVDKNQICIRINLAEEFKPAVISLEKAKELRPEVDRDPGGMLASLGITQAALEKYDKQAFSMDYKLPGSDNFNPLYVAAQRGVGINHMESSMEPIEKLRPITGDADKLWVAPPVEIVRRCKAMANVKYNAGLPSQLQALIENYIELKSILSQTKIDRNSAKWEEEYKKIADYAATAGIISPFELLSNKVINDEFIKSMPYAAFLLQHGPETNNPGDPSDLDGEMLHVHEGQEYLTETEEELVSFVLNKDIEYLENQFVMVHPGWKMEHWAPVVEKQIQLGQSDIINEATIKSYIDYQKKIFPGFPDTVEKCMDYLLGKDGMAPSDRRGSVIPEDVARQGSLHRESSRHEVDDVILHIDRRLSEENLSADSAKGVTIHLSAVNESHSSEEEEEAEVEEEVDNTSRPGPR